MIQTLCLLEMADLARRTYPHRWWCLQKELWNPGKRLNACVSSAKAPFSSDPEDVQPWCGQGSLLCTAWPTPPPIELLVRGTDILQGEQGKAKWAKICAPCNGTASVGASWWSPCLRAGGLMSNPLLMTDTTSPSLVGVRKLWGCDTEITF